MNTTQQPQPRSWHVTITYTTPDETYQHIHATLCHDHTSQLLAAPNAVYSLSTNPTPPTAVCDVCADITSIAALGDPNVWWPEEKE